MADKSLAYFMREELKEEKIISMEGPETIKDEKGEPVVFQIKKLSQDRIDQIYAMYKREEVAMDPKTNKPFDRDGHVLTKVENNYDKAFRHLIVESLVYPNLKDKQLLDFYGCIDAADLFSKMFTLQERNKITDMVNIVIGVKEEEENEDFEEAKK